MTLDELSPLVVDWFRKNSTRFGLYRDSIEAHYILNWGGFVNASFTITDGRTSYHLKLADDDWSQSCLQKWHNLKDLLHQRYRAPRMLEWVEIPGTGFIGPLFEQIHGSPADLENQTDILQGVLDLLARLHSDQELVDLLRENGEVASTCANFFFDVYIERFDEDLHCVAGDLPPFVPLSLFDWMSSETRELEGIVRELPVFQETAIWPTHSDLWISNILVSPDGAFHIIDWDDLTLGDPALEYAILLGPFWRSGKYSRTQLEKMLPPGDALRERFGICLRAFLLDGVIDNLADWVESSFAPDHQDQVRDEKERRHKQALALYQSIFT